MIKSIRDSLVSQDQQFVVVAFNPLGEQVMDVTSEPLPFSGALHRARGFNAGGRSQQLTAVVIPAEPNTDTPTGETVSLHWLKHSDGHVEHSMSAKEGRRLARRLARDGKAPELFVSEIPLSTLEVTSKPYVSTWSVYLVMPDVIDENGRVFELTHTGVSKRVAWLVWKQWNAFNGNGFIVLWPDSVPFPDLTQSETVEPLEGSDWSIILHSNGQTMRSFGGLSKRAAGLVWKQWEHTSENGVVFMWPENWPCPFINA